MRELITSNHRLMELFPLLMEQEEISYDTETTGTDWSVDIIVGFSMSWGDYNSIYVPFAHKNTPVQCAFPVVRFFAEGILRNPRIRKFMHNAKFEMHMAQSTFGWLPVDEIHDTLIMAFMVDNTQPLGLKQQTAIQFGDHSALQEETKLYAYMRSMGISKKKGMSAYGLVPAERMFSYATSDAITTLKLGRKFLPVMAEDYASVYNTERELIWVTQKMERHGMPVDRDYLKAQYPVIDLALPELNRALETEAWKGFNPNSTNDVRKLLFEKLNLPVLKRSPKGLPVTNESVLLNLDHPVIPKILQARTAKKARKVYIDNLLEASKRDSRVHGKFNQTGAGTGRFSSSGPNLQNIPREGSLPFSVRSAFVPLPGHILVFMDYVQVEWMLLAHYSRSRGLIESARSGHDFHLATASKIFKKPLDQITKPERKWSKRVNFGIAYGEGSGKLAIELKCSVKQARAFMDQYFKEFPGVKDLMDRTRFEFEKTGYVINMFGRRRKIPYDKGYRSINTLIQGSAADLMKFSMRRVARFLETTTIQLISTIHDELMFMVPLDQIHHILTIKSLMEDYRLLVPIRVDVEWSDKSWGQKRKLSELEPWVREQTSLRAPSSSDQPTSLALIPVNTSQVSLNV